VKITLKNYQLINGITAIKELINNPEMSTKTKWNFIKNLNKFQAIIDDFSKMEIDLVKKYAVKDENGDVVAYELDEDGFKKGDAKFAPGNRSKFITERNELLQCESDVDVHLIKLDDLPNIDNGNTLLLCSFLIDDSE
jgi:hypothetical protein